MPIYEYACAKCGKEFEVMQKITEAPIKTCTYCKSKKVNRLISNTAFHLKGDGWYVTDYAKKDTKKDKNKQEKSDKSDKGEKKESKGGRESTDKPAKSSKPESKNKETNQVSAPFLRRMGLTPSLKEAHQIADDQEGHH